MLVLASLSIVFSIFIYTKQYDKLSCDYSVNVIMFIINIFIASWQLTSAPLLSVTKSPTSLLL